jgi:hypothetical protein
VIVRPDGAGWYEAVFEAAGCSEVDPIPRTGWAVAPDLSSAELSVETSCGSLHAVWRAAGFPEQNDLVERWGTFSSNFGSSDPAAGGNYAVITIGVGG